MSMIGYVANLHPLLSITFRLNGLPDIQIECVVDTGFTGALALPPAAIHAMRLPFLEDMRANLANDTDIIVPVHIAVIDWHGLERRIRVLATGRRPLIGTALLSGDYLGIDFRNAGEVRIELQP